MRNLSLQLRVKKAPHINYNDKHTQSFVSSVQTVNSYSLHGQLKIHISNPVNIYQNATRTYMTAKKCINYVCISFIATLSACCQQAYSNTRTLSCRHWPSVAAVLRSWRTLTLKRLLAYRRYRKYALVFVVQVLWQAKSNILLMSSPWKAFDNTYGTFYVLSTI
jgi:hypothetical protein